MAETAAFDARVRLAVYEYFIGSGRAPIASDLAGPLDATPHDVEAAYRRLHDAHVLAPGSPYLWMAHPFSALPTAFITTVADRLYWANCIWDALGIIALLGATGSVSTNCPDCGERLLIEVTDGELQIRETVVHFAIPARQWWEDIGAA